MKKRFLLNVGTSWKYILEKSPWWGGFCECIIDIFKNFLKKVIWKLCLRYYEAETFSVEIERSLNSGPLIYMSENNFTESMTPFHLLIERTAILTILENFQKLVVLGSNCQIKTNNESY